MELVIGGAFQGKLTWALRHYGLTMADVCDLAAGDPVPGKRCYCHLEALTRRCGDAARYLPLFADAVVVTRQTIISLENGRYNASLLLAHKIARYFGLSIEDIFLFEEEEP